MTACSISSWSSSSGRTLDQIITRRARSCRPSASIADRHAGVRRARGRARAADRPSRSQAGEHHAARAGPRPRQGARLRPREVARSPIGVDDDDERRRAARHAGVHAARARARHRAMAAPISTRSAASSICSAPAAAVHLGLGARADRDARHRAGAADDGRAARARERHRSAAREGSRNRRFQTAAETREALEAALGRASRRRSGVARVSQLVR